MWVAFANCNISVNAVFNDQGFNDMLTNDIVSFEQQSPENINSTLVKYGETFYGRHTALTPAVVKINRF